MAVATLPSRALEHVRDTRTRRIGYAVLALILAVLCVFPQPFVGRAKLVPQDPSTALGSPFGSTGSGLQDLSAIFGGGRRAIDLYLAIGQSEDVRNDVIRDLHLIGSSYAYSDARSARVRLERHVTVQSLPGGVLEIETKTFDRDESLKLTSAYLNAISRRLRQLNGEQVTNKRALLEGRLRESVTRLAQAQTALDAFRRRNRISAQPETELGAAISVKASLGAQLQAKLVEEQTLSTLLGPDNPRLRAARAEIAELRARLANNTSPESGAGGPNAGGLTELNSEYVNLYRDFIFAQSLYQVYTRLSEDVAVEEVSGRSSPTVQTVETPHLDATRHFNVPAVAALAFLVLTFLFTEFYAPATGIELWRRSAIATP